LSEGLHQTDEEVALEILRYLQKHPEAKDTVNGIAQWWLLREWSERRMTDIGCALSLLLSKDLIRRVRRKGVSPYYQLNPRKLEEISKILEGSA